MGFMVEHEGHSTKERIPRLALQGEIKENFLFLFFKGFIYLFMIDIEREREAETQAEGEAGSMPGT